jgi:pimeloyl-ACP methyl ester carboxylesterase
MDKIRSTDGTFIAYERSGTGQPLMLVHAALCDHTFWQAVIPAFAKSFTVYAIDRRGRGGSGPFQDNHTIEQDYRDIAAVVDSIGSPVCLLGHSSGARYALHAALLTPHVRKLVLYDPPPLSAPPPAIMNQLQAYALTDDREGLLTTFLHDIVGESADAIAQIRQAPFWKMWLQNAQTIPFEVRSFGEYVFNAAQFKAFNIPTLLLLGSESPEVIKRQVATIHQGLPDSQVVVLNGQGHGAMYTAPDLFVKEVVGFLAST